jgi:ABC-type Na+ efflux pump permease subunit
MIFLPIVTRELRVASRRRSTYWLRTGATVVVLFLGSWLFLLMQDQPPREVGAYLFGTLTASAVLYALFSGVLSTSDCLSEEKRDGTLGLLFLTDLRGYDVVLGKLVANSVNAFYSVVAVLPVLAIPLLMGGLTPGEFGRMSLVAVNSLFASLAIGMFVSAISRSAQKAMLTTLVLIVFLTAVLPALGVFAANLSKRPWLQVALALPSAGFSYYLAWDTAYRLQTEQFWYSVLLLHGLSWICLLLASVIAPRVWQDKPAGVASLRWRERWRLCTLGSFAERTGFRIQLLSENPFYWLASRARYKPLLVWSFLALVASIWVWGVARHRRDWLLDGMYVTTALFLNSVIKVWLAVETTSRLAEERKAGTLELLLSTPLDVPDILRGQMLALRRQFLGPLVVVLIVETLFLLATLANPLSTDRIFVILLYFAAMVMLVADLIALYWVSMWQGLTARNLARATTGSLARILIFPWTVYALLLLLLVLVTMGRSNNPFETWSGFYLGLWFFLGLVADFGFGSYSRHKLLTEFRLAAQQRYTAPAGWWDRVLGSFLPKRNAVPSLVNLES